MSFSEKSNFQWEGFTKKQYKGGGGGKLSKKKWLDRFKVEGCIQALHYWAGYGKSLPSAKKCAHASPPPPPTYKNFPYPVNSPTPPQPPKFNPAAPLNNNFQVITQQKQHFLAVVIVHAPFFFFLKKTLK